MTGEKGILKTNQKRYIQDLLESENMTSYYPTVSTVKIGSTLILDQAEDH